MRRNRIVIISIMILLFSMIPTFAGGSNEGRLYYLPRNVANNKNVMIEMTQAKSLETVDRDYSNTSTNNLAVFRLRDSLMNKDQPANIVVTIRSDNNWYFYNENNPTSRVAFELEGFCVERKNTNRSYDTNYSIQKLGESTTLSKSSVGTYFKKVGSNYQMLLNTSAFTRDRLSYYADYLREYDVVVKIPQTDTSVESGYYTTTLTVTVSAYQEHDDERNKDGGQKTMTETIVLRGYAGIDTQSDEGSFSMSVYSTSETYSMDLGISSQAQAYDVANVQFHFLQLVNSEPNTNTRKNRFAIYVSPTSDYTANGTYRFIKMNTENQARTLENTIYYNLYSNQAGSSAFASSGNSLPTTTYKITPEYSSTKISSAGLGGGSNQWKETWDLNQDIYLKLTSDSLDSQRQSGLYYSYIYFTLVSN